MPRIECMNRSQCACVNSGTGGGAEEVPPVPHRTTRGVGQTLARVLSVWLLADGEPLKALASDLGVGKSTVSQWANGRRFPRPEELDGLARHLNVPVACMFCETLANSYERGADARAALSACRRKSRGVHDS